MSSTNKGISPLQVLSFPTTRLFHRPTSRSLPTSQVVSIIVTSSNALTCASRHNIAPMTAHVITYRIQCGERRWLLYRGCWSHVMIMESALPLVGITVMSLVMTVDYIHRFSTLQDFVTVQSPRYKMKLFVGTSEIYKYYKYKVSANLPA